MRRVLNSVGVSETEKFLGVYGASVINNNDPLKQNRVQLQIPQILGLATSNWAKPMGLPSNGTPPSPGTYVLAMFIGGDRNYPTYTATQW